MFIRDTEAIWAIATLAAMEPEYLDVDTRGGTAMFSGYEINAQVTQDGVLFCCVLIPNRRYGEQGGEWTYSGPRGIIEALAGDETAVSVLLTAFRRFLSVLQDWSGASMEWYQSMMFEMGKSLEESLIAS